MKVSKTSWHYKLIKSWWIQSQYKEPESNLCPYMRQLLCAFIKVSMIGFILGIFVLFALATLLAPIAYLVQTYWFALLPASWFAKESALWFGIILGTATYFVLFCRLISMAYEWCNFRFMDRLFGYIVKKVDNRKPGVFGQWYKDWHDKTCTPIEFVDNDTQL